MRKQFMILAKAQGVHIYNYTSHRADQQAMTYDVYVKGFGLFHDGYFIGDPAGKIDLLSRFDKFIKKPNQ